MKKIKVLLSGIGNRALPKNPGQSNWLGWVKLIAHSEYFELVAAQDVSLQARQRLVVGKYLASSRVYEDLNRAICDTQADAIVISNPIEHHAQTIETAINNHLHILVEKPFVQDIEAGRRLVKRIAGEKNLVCCVVQNWRTKDTGALLRASIQSNQLGRIGHLVFRYIRNRENPNYPAYIFREPYPLLYAMGIHHLDLFRYILDDEFESVSGQSFKPPWSLYESDTGVNLSLKTAKGITVIYSGTFSSQNSLLPQESLLVEGEKGTLYNESDWLEPPLYLLAKNSREKINLTQSVSDSSISGQYNISDRRILDNFYQAILGKENPICPASDGLSSVEIVEAARRACELKINVML